MTENLLPPPSKLTPAGLADLAIQTARSGDKLYIDGSVVEVIRPGVVETFQLTPQEPQT